MKLKNPTATLDKFFGSEEPILLAPWRYVGLRPAVDRGHYVTMVQRSPTIGPTRAYRESVARLYLTLRYLPLSIDTSLRNVMNELGLRIIEVMLSNLPLHVGLVLPFSVS